MDIFVFNAHIWLPSFAQEVGGSCPDLSVTGIRSKDELSKLVNSLKAAAVAKDKAAISKFVIFPLRVNGLQKREPIRDETELKNVISNIFTPKILEAIESQKFDEIFCRDQGAMIGNGEVWIKERNGKIGITTINL